MCIRDRFTPYMPPLATPLINSLLAKGTRESVITINIGIKVYSGIWSIDKGTTETLSINHVGRLTTFPFIMSTHHPCVCVLVEEKIMYHQKTNFKRPNIFLRINLNKVRIF